jgi:aspartyl-tRNA(Asn)/glutamyl-tRNA(Gln) amidotransferase subunit A
MIAFASSLDQGGPMALTAQDLALMLNAMAGHDPRDSTSIERPQEDFSAMLEKPLAGLRLGVPAEYWDASLDPAMRLGMTAALDQFRALGASVREVHLPHAAVSIPAYYVVACAEASSNLSRYDGVRFGHRCAAPQDLNDLYSRSRAEGFGAEVKRRILVGTYALSAGYYDAWYRKAQQLRRLIQQDFAAAFAEVDLLIGPTTPTTAFPLGSNIEDPLTMYLADVYTTGVNLAGLPALSVPAGFLAGLPFGLQLVGNYFSEARLLQAAHQYQTATPWHLQRPALVGRP